MVDDYLCRIEINESYSLELVVGFIACLDILSTNTFYRTYLPNIQLGESYGAIRNKKIRHKYRKGLRL